MAIPLDLLRKTDGRALGILPYGGPGLRKSLAIHTLPPPILMFDFEGGAIPLKPWLRSRVNWDGTKRIVFTQEERQEAWDAVGEANRLLSRVAVPPLGLIDVVWFDPLEYKSYDVLFERVSAFPLTSYNSCAIDSLQEFSAETQTYSKGESEERQKLTMAEAGAWAGAQERAMIMLRKLRSYRDRGLFLYMTCSELIDKDYVTDPRNQAKGAKEEPYSVKGTANLPGKLPGFIQHVTDLMLHCRMMGPNPVWVAKSEPIGAGGAYWEAKDRTGRVTEEYNPPSVAKLLDQIYGEELRKAIYGNQELRKKFMEVKA